MKRAVLIGAGRMGGAMAQGWLGDLGAAGLSHLAIVEPNPSPELTRAAGEGTVTVNGPASASDIVVIAVKPQSFGASSRDIAAWVGPDTLAISIMAGLPVSGIRSALGVERVIRAMPNTPGAIGRGITAFTASASCSSEDIGVVRRLLAPLGEVVGPLPEGQMDAVTAVSGSGPAYVFLLAEALEAAGRSAGLDSDTAARLARATVTGAAALIRQGGEPDALRRAVTSPGGTTAAALDVLMAQGGLPDLMRKAVDAAVKRGIELARTDT